MHFVKSVKYVNDYKLAITFEDNKKKLVDLSNHIGNGVFKKLQDIAYFKTVKFDEDLDTIVWDNGADISPDFLYEIGEAIEN
jgi:Protein of unknown function (DUF2442)